MTEANKPTQPLGFGSTDRLGRAPFEERRMTIDKKRIADEAQHFFEWPDPKHRDTVTLTSCVIFAATIAEMVIAENIGRGEKLADELRGEIARLHGAVCQAVALLNRADFGRSAEVAKAHDILREVLVSHADECEDCHAKAGMVCADSDCPGRRAQAA